MWRIYGQLGAEAGARVVLPRPRLLGLCCVSMSCAEAERRTTCVLWQQDARTTAERSFEGSCQKAGNPLRAAKKNGSELCLPYAKRVQVVVAVAVAVSVCRLGGEIDMQMHNVSHTVLWQVSVSVPLPVPGLPNVARI